MCINRQLTDKKIENDIYEVLKRYNDQGCRCVHEVEIKTEVRKKNYKTISDINIRKIITDLLEKKN